MKKGIELSLNFLVTIIIALVIFGLGIKFIRDIASQATELEGLTTDDLDKKIEDLLCESTEKVCIGTNKKTIEKGNFDVFGLKIMNILDTREFGIEVKKPSPSGYTKNNEPIDTNNIKLKYRNTVLIERNKEENIGIGVEVPKNAVSGNYILNVNVVYTDNEGSKNYDTMHKIYVEVP